MQAFSAGSVHHPAEHDHPDAAQRHVGANQGQRLQSVDVGHHHVEQNAVGPLPSGLRETGLGVGRRAHDELPVQLEEEPSELPHVLGVIDHEQASRTHDRGARTEKLAVRSDGEVMSAPPVSRGHLNIASALTTIANRRSFTGMRLLLAIIAFLPVVTACGRTATLGPPADKAAGGQRARVAEVWLTTGNRTHLLARQPDLPLGSPARRGDVVIDVDESVTYQTMVGFGAAVTDASAYLLHRTLGPGRDAVMRELFDPSAGLGLSFVRVPMGASDFSSAHYSYDDAAAGRPRDAPSAFSIDADRSHKLPVLRRALAFNPRIRFVASPWSAPAWMKSNGSLIQGTLRPGSYGAYADYLRRFVEAYAAEGVPIFAITLQNEPAFEPPDYPGMRLSSTARAELIGRYVGPLFAESGVATRILEWDHNWDHPEEPLAVLADTIARRYVSGVAWHCYAGSVGAQEVVRLAHPDMDVYFTECSGGAWSPDFADNLQWTVSTLLIGSVRAWARGVALWNLALDETGGPHLGGCGNCRGVITIDSRSGAVTRNEEYYALAHASRFVRPGAHRIASSTDVGGLQSVAFRNADDDSRVLIVLNTGTSSVPLTIRARHAVMSYAMPAKAVATFRWR